MAETGFYNYCGHYLLLEYHRDNNLFIINCRADRKTFIKSFLKWAFYIFKLFITLLINNLDLKLNVK